MFDEISTGRDIGVMKFSSLSISPKSNNYINEGSIEDGSRFIEFSDSDVLTYTSNSEKMVNLSFQEIPQNTANGKCDSIVNCDHNILLSIGFIIGAVLVIFVYDILPLIFLSQPVIR